MHVNLDNTKQKTDLHKDDRKESHKPDNKPDKFKFYIWSNSWDKIKAAKRDLDKVAEAQCYQKSLHEYSKVVSSLKNDQVI